MSWLNRGARWSCWVAVSGLALAVGAGCEGGSDEIVSCNQTNEEEANSEVYCFTGYDSFMGDGNDTCSAEKSSCVGPNYGSSAGFDIGGRIFRAYARCSNGTYITCKGTLSATAGVHGNGQKYVSCFGPGLVPDVCW